ncbi:Uncharacterised protein [Serratia plymuthica]|nr:Uncharacterised protein [Serratia plymuthica]VEI16995.1 Uncharacterised protein [Serratia plymuthica]
MTKWFKPFGAPATDSQRVTDRVALENMLC